MFFHKKSVLTRTIIAVAIPLVAVFILINLLAAGVVRKGAEEFAGEVVSNYAELVSIRISDRLSVMNTALSLTRRNLEGNDIRIPEGKRSAERILQNMLLSADGVYSGWFVYELPEDDGKRFIRSFVKSSRRTREIHNITDELLNDPKASAWYDLPFRSGSNYYVVADQHDYGLGEGPVYRGTLTQPIKRDGVVIGCVGVDVVYRQILHFLHDVEAMKGQRVLSLIDATGTIIYTTKDDNTVTDTLSLLVSPEQIREAQSNQRPALRFSKPGERDERVLVCLAPLALARSNANPFVYIELPLSNLTAASLRQLHNMTLICLICFLLLSVAMYLVMRSVVTPVKNLTEKADAIAAGNLNVDFGDDGNGGPSANELEILRAALKKMVSQLGDVHDLKLAAITADFERDRERAASEARSRFFATISHEIRTPMNAIIGMSELLMRDNLKEREKSRVQDIKLSAVSLLRLINDILDASKMEAGKFELAPEDYELSSLIDGVCSVAELMARKKRLKFIRSIPDDLNLPRCLYGDAERVRQILLNILSNAVKYTSKGEVRFSIEYANGKVIFLVKDTGMGIRQEALPHIFNPYSQAQDGGKRHIEGTGLGLSITKQLVDLMRGTVSAQSVHGEGSEFRVELPVTPGDPARMAALHRIEEGGEWKAHALVVDDNRVNLKVAEGLLRIHGLTVETALSGEQALDLARKTSFDLIFMDHMMPGMDGVETTEAIRAMGGWRMTVPIIALTANVMPQSQEMFLKSGMDDFLGKPIQIEKLVQILGEWLPEEMRVTEGHL